MLELGIDVGIVVRPGGIAAPAAFTTPAASEPASVSVESGKGGVRTRLKVGVVPRGRSRGSEESDTRVASLRPCGGGAHLLRRASVFPKILRMGKAFERGAGSIGSTVIDRNPRRPAFLRVSI